MVRRWDYNKNRSTCLGKPHPSVIDPNEVQSLRWCGFSGRRAIVGDKDRVKAGRRALLETYLDERADERPNHLLQKSVRIDFDSQSVALSEHRQMLQVADGIFVFGRLSLERREIVPSNQRQRSLIHQRIIERIIEVPTIIQGSLRTLCQVENTVFV